MRTRILQRAVAPGSAVLTVPMLTLLMALAALTWSPAGWAQASDRKPTTLYTCKDASGRMLTSDRPIAECANQPLRELNGNGIVTREIPAPLTAEQLRRKAAADEAARVEQIRVRQAMSRDRALMLAYSSLDALETARNRQLADMRYEINLAQKRMVAGHKDLIAANATLSSQTTKPGQDAAKRNVRLIAQSILADDAAISRINGELKEVDDRFDADAQRLRQLLREPDPIVQASRPVNPTR